MPSEEREVVRKMNREMGRREIWVSGRLNKDDGRRRSRPTQNSGVKERPDI
jgi:hypothetical protein